VHFLISRKQYLQLNFNEMFASGFSNSFYHMFSVHCSEEKEKSQVFCKQQNCSTSENRFHLQSKEIDVSCQSQNLCTTKNSVENVVYAVASTVMQTACV